MQLAGLKGPSKHSSAADENTHFTSTIYKGRCSEVGCETPNTELTICTSALTIALAIGGHKADA